jgi:hypothetical protein
MRCTEAENILKSQAYEKPAYCAFSNMSEKDTLDSTRIFLKRKPFGEIGYVKTGKKIQGKLDDREEPMMYLGPALDHGRDTFRMLNLKTKRVINTRDVIWTGKVYGDWKGLTKPTIPDGVTTIELHDTKVEEEYKSPSEHEDQQEETNTEQKEAQQNDEDTTDDRHGPIDEGATKSQSRREQGNPKMLRELSKLSAYYNQEATSLADRIRKAKGNKVPEDDQASHAFVMIDRFGGFCGIWSY